MKERQENAKNGFLWALGLQILQTFYFTILSKFSFMTIQYLYNRGKTLKFKK